MQFALSKAFQVLDVLIYLDCYNWYFSYRQGFFGFVFFKIYLFLLYEYFACYLNKCM